eukprot:c23032_g1_i3 orf=241-1317(-)
MSHSRNPFDSDDESGSPVKSSAKAAINPFDDALQQPESRQGSRNQFKARVSASGDAALKKVQKIKDAGSSQASKIVNGGVSQMHKMKESSYGALKSNNAHSNPLKGSVDSRNGHGDPQLRDELFEGTAAAKATRVRYDDSQFQQQDLEYKSVEDLEGYAVQKSEETTVRVHNALRVAEEIKGDATRTLLTLHEQGDQIRRTHNVAVDIDHNLSAGEKLLGSLGGIFSKTWKPKKGRPISGPALSKNDSFKRRGHHLEQRVALGLNRSNSKGRANRAPLTATNRQQNTTYDKLEMEKAKQDDALETLSNVLSDLKIMGQDMGHEIASQNDAIDGVQTDVETLGDRVVGANRRAQRLLGR